MTTSIVEKPMPANVTVKLDFSERERIKQLAVAKKRTPHYLMREAIQRYLEEEEVAQRFIEVAKQSRQHHQETGLHVTHAEVSQWIEALESNPQATLPACHK
jgi:predicted transcriptional regulator